MCGGTIEKFTSCVGMNTILHSRCKIKPRRRKTISQRTSYGTASGYMPIVFPSILSFGNSGKASYTPSLGGP